MYDDIVEVSSIDELLEKMEEMFEDACGATAVEGFNISCPDKPEIDMYFWDNMDLKRNRDLSDVWDKERRNIKEYFEQYFFENENENEKKDED